MKSHVIEMTRSVERRLVGGESETLTAGTRYTMDDTTAKALCSPTREVREVNGAMQEVEVEPAATIVQTFEIETSAEKAAREAEAQTAGANPPPPATPLVSSPATPDDEE